MRWRKGRRSTNVIDKRGSRVKQGAAVGGGTLVMALVAIFVLGQDPGQVLQQVTSQQQQQQRQGPAQPEQRSAAENEAADFVTVVLADTEDTWNPLFARAGSRYKTPELVLFTGSTPTACGYGQAASGPFYCPGDQRLYLDLSFLSELQRMGATGDFSVAYVIAHEVGHHVQTITGISKQVRAAQQRTNKVGANQLQVRMELQADCYAGIWAHHADKARGILEAGDVEEGLSAASAVGDDHLQKMSGRGVHPETFTHGTSAQRMEWFQRGLQNGSIDACNTFGS